MEFLIKDAAYLTCIAASVGCLWGWTQSKIKNLEEAQATFVTKEVNELKHSSIEKDVKDVKETLREISNNIASIKINVAKIMTTDEVKKELKKRSLENGK